MTCHFQLPPGCTMALYRAEELVYSSQGRWLHPLFECGDFLETQPDLIPSQLLLVDRMIGKAAAFLVLHLGIRRVYALRLSLGAKNLLETHGLDLDWEELIERTLCATEDLLEQESDLERAFALLQDRRLKALARQTHGG